MILALFLILPELKRYVHVFQTRQAIHDALESHPWLSKA